MAHGVVNHSVAGQVPGMLGTGRPKPAELVSCFWVPLFVWDPKNIREGQHPAPHLGLLAPGGADMVCLLQPAGKHVGGKHAGGKQAGGKHARGRVDKHQQTCRAVHAPGTHTVQQPGPTHMPPAGALCPGGGSGAQVPRGPPNRRGRPAAQRRCLPKWLLQAHQIRLLQQNA